MINGLSNAYDLKFSEMAAVAFSLVVTLTALELESDALFAAELVNDLSLDCCTFDYWGSYFSSAAVVDEENLIKRNFGINISDEFLDVNLITCLYAVLLTACFKNCVCHGLTSKWLND